MRRSTRFEQRSDEAIHFEATLRRLQKENADLRATIIRLQQEKIDDDEIKIGGTD